MPDVVLINTPDTDKPITRDMAGGLGFDRGSATLLPPLDLLGYATVLDRAGWTVRLIDGQLPSGGRETIAAALNERPPDAVVMTLSMPSLDADLAFARWLRERMPASSRLAVKTGIRHPPLVARILTESGCDPCIVGEGDLRIGALLTRECREGTAHLDDQGGVVFVPEDLAPDLDSLPVSDRRFLDNPRYTYPGLGPNTTAFQTSRGCPFRCSYYCPYPLVQGKAWRAMSAGRIVEELAAIAAAGIGQVLFRDATFTLDHRRIEEMCRLIGERDIRLRWWCETRIDRLSPDLLAAMAAAGCVGMNVGVETGDETLMARTAKPGLSLDRVMAVRARCRDLGIVLRFLMMIGLPGETRQTLLGSLRLIHDLRPDFLGLTTVTPYPGTPFHADAVAQGWIRDDDVNSFGGHSFNVAIPPLTSEDLGHALRSCHAMHHLTRGEEPPDGAERRSALLADFERWAAS